MSVPDDPLLPKPDSATGTETVLPSSDEALVPVLDERTDGQEVGTTGQGEQGGEIAEDLTSLADQVPSGEEGSPVDVPTAASVTDEGDDHEPTIEAWRPAVLGAAVDVLLSMLTAVEGQIAMVQDLAGPERALLSAKFDALLTRASERSALIRARRDTAIKHTKPDGPGHLRIVRYGRQPARDQAPAGDGRETEGDILRSSLGTGAEEPIEPTIPQSKPRAAKTASASASKKGRKVGGRRRSRPGKADTAAAVYARVVEKIPMDELKLEGFRPALYDDHAGYEAFREAGRYVDDETTRMLYYVLSVLGVNRLRRFSLMAPATATQGSVTFTLRRLEALEIENLATLVSNTASMLTNPEGVDAARLGKFGPTCLRLVRQWLLSMGLTIAGENHAEASALVKADSGQ
jgi:hypothetical protein